MAPKFSVIVPTYNRRSMLAEALDSIARQTFTDYELIVVDDGSTDGTREWLVETYPDVTVLSQKNMGPGAARNLGVQHARGEYVAFLDSDDVWFPWSLATHFRAIVEGNRPAITSGCEMTFTKLADLCEAREGAISVLYFPTLLHACDATSLPIGGTPATTVRREVLIKHGGFPAAFITGEDFDTWLRLAAEEGFARIVSPAVFGRRRHADHVSHSLDRHLAGMRHLIDQERTANYPGGKRFRRRRIRILATAARNSCVVALRQGEVQKGWWLYRETFWWQVSQGRVRFLAAIPILCLLAWLRPGRA